MFSFYLAINIICLISLNESFAVKHNSGCNFSFPRANFRIGISQIRLSSSYFVNVPLVLINEVVTEPKQDWSTNGFNGIPGAGSINEGTDEWIELLILETGLNLTGWTIELLDGSDVAGNLTSSGAFDVSNYLGAGSFTNTVSGDFLVLGNVDGSGAMNNSITINLKNPNGDIVDAVTFGTSPSSNSGNIFNESAQRFPNGTDSDTPDDWTQGQPSPAIFNTGPSVTVSGSSAEIGENSESIILTATLCATSKQTTTVAFSVSGTAISGTDYLLSSSLINIPAGSLTGSVTLNSVQDSEFETDETVVVDISSVINGTEAGIQHVPMTITDDDAPAVVSVTASSANGNYQPGDSLIIIVNFNAIVQVNGSPQLILETGASDQNAVYISGHETPNLEFRYVVQAGDFSCGLDYTTTNALVLNGGTITSNGINVLLTLPHPGSAGSLGASKSITIDTESPVLKCLGDTTVYFDSNCEYAIADLCFRATASDNCGTVTLSQSLSGMATLSGDGDSRTVLITANDGNGNSDSCSFTITALDTIRPVMVCHDTIVYLDNAGKNIFNAQLLTYGSSDNCEIVSVSPENFSMDCENTANAIAPRQPWINEFHYDNNSTDVNEFVEIAGSSGFNLAGYKLLFYNGTDGLVYKTTTLTGIIPDETGGYGTLSFLISGIQNGPAEGIALITPSDSTVQFISYEGAITAVDEAAIGLTSTDVGASEPGTAPETASISYLGETGWVYTTASSPGALNPSQLLPGKALLYEITANDEAGNFASCQSRIEVRDTIPSTPGCQDLTIYLDTNGQATLTADTIGNRSTDNCGIKNICIDKTSFSCDNTGDNTVRLTVTDLSGNEAVCEATITVTDTIPPTALCRDTAITLNANGSASLTASMIDNKSTDNCGIRSLNLSQSNFGCFDLGYKTVTLKVTDVNGLVSTCQSTVNIKDLTKPVAICRDTTFCLDSAGRGYVSPLDIAGLSTDNCGISSWSLDKNIFSIRDVGVNTVHAEVEDRSGNISTCTATVTVIDTIKPVVTCLDTTLFLDASGEISIGTLNLLLVAADNCGITSITPDTISLDCSDTRVELASGLPHFNEFHYDNAGTDVNEFVEIAGKAGANLSGYKILFYNGSDSSVYKTLNLSGIIADQASGYGVVSFAVSGIQNGPSDGFALISPESKVIDFISYEGKVTAAEGEASGLTSDETGVLEPADSPLGTSVCLNADGGWELTGAATPGLINPGQHWPLNTRTFRISATDASGNTSGCYSHIEIIDNFPPTAICQNVTISLDENGEAVISADLIDKGSFDNCSIDTVYISQTNFDCSNLDENQIVLTAADNSGNTSTCSAWVTVTDTIRPKAICKDISIELDQSGIAVVTPEQVDNGSTDNCSIQILSLSQTRFDCSDIGENPVELSVADASGNVSVCQAKVAIIDTIAPITVCKSATIWLDENREAHLTPGMIDAGTTDNCDILSLGIDKTEFTYTETGHHQIRLQVVDRSGNRAFCVSTVTVVDTLPPKVVCKDTILYLDALGSATIETSKLALNAAEFKGFSPETLLFGCPTQTSFILPEKPWINEFHYDNDGTDEGEFVEIAGKAGINLGGYKLLFYNGGDGKVYKTITLSGIVADENGGYGAVSFPISGIQNGPADGFALVSGSGEVLEFISYEGVVIAVDGNASGHASTDAEVAEESFTPVGASVSLNPLNRWKYTTTATPGQLNPGQHWPVVIESTTITATDYSGNQSTCFSHIEIKETIAPQVAVHTAELSLDEHGTAQLTPEMVIKSSSDNCSINGYELNKTTFDCANLGENNVILTATDLFGNKTSVPVLVLIADTLPPVLSPVTDYIVWLEPGSCKGKIDYPEISAADNCSAKISFVEGKGANAVFEPGVYTEKFVAKDASGNSDSLEFTITVVANNGTPAFSNIPMIIIDEDSPFEIQLTGITDGDECIQQYLTFKVTSELQSVISGLTIEFTQGATTAMVKGTLKPDWFGETLITITLSDNENGNVTRSFILRVTPVNDPPVLVAPLPDFEINAAHIIKIPVPSNTTAMFYDPDDEYLAISAFEAAKTSLPGFITFANDSITIYPMITDTGRITIVIKATDSSFASVTDTFDVLVLGYKTGIHDIAAETFPVVFYPNPTNRNLNISLGDKSIGNIEVEIYSVEGGLKFRKQFRLAKIQIDVSSFADGLYYTRIRSGKREVVKNFVMKRE